MINIDFPSIPTAGDKFSFTCRATVPERLVHVPSGFSISYNLAGNMRVADDNSDATESSLMSNGNVFSRYITLNPVKTSDATNYFCRVVFQDLGTSTNNNRMLNVISKSFLYNHISYIHISSSSHSILSYHVTSFIS